MKIVYITTSVTGGAGIAAFRLYSSLQNYKEIDSHLIQKVDTLAELQNQNISTLYESNNLWYRIKRKLGLTVEEQQQKLIPTYSVSNQYEIATFPITSYRIEEHPLIKEADIIHLHWVAGFLNYPSFFKKIKKPIVWTLHDMNAFLGVFHYQDDINRNAASYSSLEKKTNEDKIRYLRQCENIHIVTPSKWLRELSQGSEALKRFQHYVIPYGIAKNEVSIDNESAKKTLGINNNYPVLLFIAHGLDIYRKGFDLLSDAISTINSTSINLLTVGGEKIETKQNKNINHIHIPSTYDRDKLNMIYSTADITILPSREDNLPNVMIESLINGTPIISFSNGGMAEHITTGKTGILIDKIGVAPLQKAIESYLKKEFTFDREKIKTYAELNFDLDKQAREYIDLYNLILNDRVI